MRGRRHKLAVSTFPFLAVLLCAMGSLILILLVMDRKAHQAVQARAKREAAQLAEQSAHTEAAQRAELEQKKKQARTAWEQKRESLHTNLTREQIDLQLQMRKVRDQFNQIAARLRYEQDTSTELRHKVQDERSRIQSEQLLLATLRSNAGHSDTQAKEASKTVQRMTLDLLRMEQALKDLKAARKREQHTFSVVPYHGRRGESRRPIYVECTSEGVIFHPGHRAMSVTSREFLIGRNQPGETPDDVRSEVERRIAQQRARKDLTPAQAKAVPYLLLLVRPDGIQTNEALQAVLRDMPIEFGYEFIDDDWVLDFPSDEDQPNAQPWMVATKTQSAATSTAPSKNGGVRPAGMPARSDPNDSSSSVAGGLQPGVALGSGNWSMGSTPPARFGAGGTGSGSGGSGSIPPGGVVGRAVSTTPVGVRFTGPSDGRLEAIGNSPNGVPGLIGGSGPYQAGALAGRFGNGGGSGGGSGSTLASLGSGGNGSGLGGGGSGVGRGGVPGAAGGGGSGDVGSGVAGLGPPRALGSGSSGTPGYPGGGVSGTPGLAGSGANGSSSSGGGNAGSVGIGAGGNGLAGNGAGGNGSPGNGSGGNGLGGNGSGGNGLGGNGSGGNGSPGNGAGGNGSGGNGSSGNGAGGNGSGGNGSSGNGGGGNGSGGSGSPGNGSGGSGSPGNGSGGNGLGGNGSGGNGLGGNGLGGNGSPGNGAGGNGSGGNGSPGNGGGNGLGGNGSAGNGGDGNGVAGSNGSGSSLPPGASVGGGYAVAGGSGGNGSGMPGGAGGISAGMTGGASSGQGGATGTPGSGGASAGASGQGGGGTSSGTPGMSSTGQPGMAGGASGNASGTASGGNSSAFATADPLLPSSQPGSRPNDGAASGQRGPPPARPPDDTEYQGAPRKKQLVNGGGGGAGEPEDSGGADLNRYAPPTASVPQRRKPVVMRPAWVHGGRDWTIFVECRADAAILYPSEKSFPLAQVASAASDNPLVTAIQQMIARRQSGRRPGDPPFYPQVRLLVRSEHVRAFLTIYPALQALSVPIKRQNLDDDDNVLDIIQAVNP